MEDQPDYIRAYREKYPNSTIPDYAIPRPNQSKQTATNRLTDEVIAYVGNLGGVARRVNVQGRVIAGKKVESGLGYTVKTKDKWIPSGMREGYEDIDATIPIQLHGRRFGLKMAIEVKAGQDQMSPAQWERKAEVEAAGGVYIIARTLKQARVDILQAITSWQ